MKSTPILFNGPMAKAILEGRKTMTRRVAKPQPTFNERSGLTWKSGAYGIQLDGKPYLNEFIKECPYGTVGDTLWVRETWQQIPTERPSGYFSDPKLIGKNYWYRATDHVPTWGGKWRQSIFMPVAACRITLEIVNVLVERLNDISDGDCRAEGINVADFLDGTRTSERSKWKSRFKTLWDEINGKKHPWKSNPWVWVVEFKRIETQSK